jgi:hypothetical protein
MNKNDYLKKFKRSMEAMLPKAMAFPWHDEEAYRMWLAQTHYIVRHTSHFVCLAAGLTPVENREEHYHLIEHLKEEEHHDLLLVSDLKHFDVKVEDYPELPETALVWQNLYYWLSLRKPRSILGHSLCIEGLAGHAGPQLMPRLRKIYPEEAIRFLIVHFEADKKHFEQGMQLLQSFDLADLQDISRVQDQSSVLYLNMLAAITEHCRRGTGSGSAAA